MKRQEFGWAAASFGLLLLALPALAGPITWNYHWTDSPAIINADNQGTGGIALTAMAPGIGPANGVIKATILNVFGSAPASAPDHYTNGKYSLVLHLTDAASNASGDLTWTGAFNGTANINLASISNTFTSPMTQQLTLGGNLYQVTIGPYVAPLTATNVLGEIDATVSVGSAPTNQPPPTSNTPEPTTLVLAVLGLGFGGLTVWRKAG
jgi:hypothetical protein